MAYGKSAPQEEAEARARVRAERRDRYLVKPLGRVAGDPAVRRHPPVRSWRRAAIVDGDRVHAQAKILGHTCVEDDPSTEERSDGLVLAWPERQARSAEGEAAVRRVHGAEHPVQVLDATAHHSGGGVWAVVEAELGQVHALRRDPPLAAFVGGGQPLWVQMELHVMTGATRGAELRLECIRVGVEPGASMRPHAAHVGEERSAHAKLPAHRKELVRGTEEHVFCRREVTSQEDLVVERDEEDNLGCHRRARGKPQYGKPVSRAIGRCQSRKRRASTQARRSPSSARSATTPARVIIRPNI